ncbi:AGAP009601-PA-like protein [Anopheles sinensis]|uniref:AGAP009601-PA-like protein n=1 Tax=Anopheles sinensis TaxID=74873 RepID=A0A084VGN3_ANOSI|nr:AGAP009601-PA-like protein [Anopheles sinensis]
MHINNTDALKLWLTEVLEPLCDADPAALARYVLALLKKDKPEKDLIVSMKEQLDVFLTDATQPFLEQLFKVIKSEEYLKTPAAVSAAPAAGGVATSNGAAVAQASSISTSSTTAAVTGPSVGSGSTNHTEEVTSSSRVRVKREFTPPLHESVSRAGKDSSSTTGSSATVSSMSTSGSDRTSSHQASKGRDTTLGSGGSSGSSTTSSTANHHNTTSVSSITSTSQKSASRLHSPSRGSNKDDHSTTVSVRFVGANNPVQQQYWWITYSECAPGLYPGWFISPYDQAVQP